MFLAHKQVCTICRGGENSFLNLYWYLNRPAPASQHLLGGLNGVVGCFPHINRFAPSAEDLHSGENCFHNLYWHLNRPSRASQPTSVVKTTLYGASRIETGLHQLHRTSSVVKTVSPPLLALPQSCTCFTVPLWR